ncbi:Craniofacial development protein 1, partial [Coemansia sp. RSA 2611]
MSLLDLYKDAHDLSDDEESEDEFVPDQASGGDEATNDEEESDSDGEKADKAEKEVDAIWTEMNDPVDPRSNKMARVGTDSGDALEIAPAKEDEVDTPPTETSSETVADAEQPQPVARRGPVRRVSKFSQMAKAVESRRAKKENTLEQARKEWTGFVAAEGIRDDLDQANKDGFVERQEFLRRTDERAYEKSRQEHMKR